MFDAFWPLLVFVPFFVLMLVQALRRRHCPECGERLPAFQSPFTKTERQWAFGGWVCRACGCEVDVQGRPVDPDAPVRGTGRRMLLLWAALMFGGLVSGAAFFVILWAPATPTPAAAPPPAVTPPADPPG